MRKYFGTDGIRGTANGSTMTVEIALKLGRAVATYFKRSRRPKILVGKDTRLSGYMLEAALIAGITSTGADVILLGPIPTPGIAFLTTSMRADAGIVLSASHNSFEDNGLKVFGDDGFKLPDRVELEIEALMEADPAGLIVTNEAIGRAKRVEDATGRYVTHLKTMLAAKYDLTGLRIVVDCANGAAYKAAPMLFSELGAEVIPIAISPNGENINFNCGALHPERAAKMVLKTNAHLGVCLDGDADRLILIDEKGQVIDGDAVLLMCAFELQDRGRLHHNTVVSTVMSNMGLERALKKRGIRLERTQVGDRYVVKRMRYRNYNFGGEQSGHLVFLDNGTTGDGLGAAIEVLNLMLSSKKPLSELGHMMKRFPQILLNRKVVSKPPLDTLATVQLAMRNVRNSLGEDGRVVVRYSGTEKKVRVMVEGLDQELIRKSADEIMDAFGVDVGFTD